ncbi:MAG: hypothetical protein WC169_10025 [Dehalococcoidia bacterium]|jgi:hypothetical protein
MEKEGICYPGNKKQAGQNCLPGIADCVFTSEVLAISMGSPVINAALHAVILLIYSLGQVLWQERPDQSRPRFFASHIYMG